MRRFLTNERIKLTCESRSHSAATVLKIQGSEPETKKFLTDLEKKYAQGTEADSKHLTVKMILLKTYWCTKWIKVMGDIDYLAKKI